MDERSKLVNNERLKLLSTFLNGLGIAIFAVGALAPLISTIYASNPVKVAFWSAMGVCISIAFGLHYIASVLLKRLRS